MQKSGKITSLIAALAVSALFLTGCQASLPLQLPETLALPEELALPEAPYFKKGVYACYPVEAGSKPRTFFYIFNEDNYGHTEDGEYEGMGIPFEVSQEKGKVSFSYGGEGEVEDVFRVMSVKDGTIRGYFTESPYVLLVYEPVKDADPDTFSAENYVRGPEDCIYRDPNGWSCRYDSTRFQISQDGPNVFIVYTGESAGTNMITVTYDPEKTGEKAVRELGESWSEDTEYIEGPFPGAEYATGYWAVPPFVEGGSGLYMSALGRDYMDGSLVFEFTEHKGNDEEMNMEVSDYLAGIIDSLTWNVYSFDTIIQSLPEDSYYAFADMDPDRDALLVAKEDTVFDYGGGVMASTEADVYGYDWKDCILGYGRVEGGGTATPLAAKDGKLYFGGHKSMNKVHIDEASSEMIVDEGAYFDEYEDAEVVAFTKAGES